MQHQIFTVKQHGDAETRRKAMVRELDSVFHSDIFRKNALRLIFDPEVASGMKEWEFSLRGRIHMRLFLLLVLSGHNNLAIRMLDF